MSVVSSARMEAQLITLLDRHERPYYGAKTTNSRLLRDHLAKNTRLPSAISGESEVLKNTNTFPLTTDISVSNVSSRQTNLFLNLSYCVPLPRVQTDQDGARFDSACLHACMPASSFVLFSCEISPAAINTCNRSITATVSSSRSFLVTTSD